MLVLQGWSAVPALNFIKNKKLFYVVFNRLLKIFTSYRNSDFNNINPKLFPSICEVRVLVHLSGLIKIENIE